VHSGFGIRTCSTNGVEGAKPVAKSKGRTVTISRAFSSQVETPDGSENAIKQQLRAPVLIPSKPAL